jgi:hypothetical protein
MSGRSISDLLMEFEPRRKPSPLPGPLPTAERVVPFERRVMPTPATPEADLKVKIEEAYLRGKADGRMAAIADCDEKLKEYALAALKQSGEDRERWVREQSGVIVERLEAAWKELETGITDTLARLLEPVLVGAIRQQALHEFVAHLNAIVNDGDKSALRISGPADLLGAVRSRLAGSRLTVDYVTQARSEVHLTSNQAVLETQMQVWIERLKQALS